MPTLLVRNAMHVVCTLGCAASLLPLALDAIPSPLTAVACLTANLSFYAFSYSGFHAYLQDVADKDAAGVLQVGGLRVRVRAKVRVSVRQEYYRCVCSGLVLGLGRSAAGGWVAAARASAAAVSPSAY